jgi:hypothetical protein
VETKYKKSVYERIKKTGEGFVTTKPILMETSNGEDSYVHVPPAASSSHLPSIISRRHYY